METDKKTPETSRRRWLYPLAVAGTAAAVVTLRALAPDCALYPALLLPVVLVLWPFRHIYPVAYFYMLIVGGPEVHRGGTAGTALLVGALAALIQFGVLLLPLCFYGRNGRRWLLLLQAAIFLLHLGAALVLFVLVPLLRATT